jgi:hypothetical protein
MITSKFSADMIAKDLNSGYWKVDQQYFFHKADALRYATLINSTVSYHFFDQYFDSANWSIEPAETYQELCKRRAQDLRDRYRYVALSFSGGADSTNVLNAFVNNGIKLDEVITYYHISDAEKLKSNFNINDKRNQNLMFEYMASVEPKLKWLAKNHPEIKITVLDTSESSRKMILDSSVHSQTLAGVMPASNTGHSQVRDHMLQYGSDSVTVHGVDKPRLGYDHEWRKFYTYFHDFNTCHGNWSHRPGEYPKTEYFYYAPMMPELLIKAVLAVKNAVTPIVDTDFFKTIRIDSFAGPRFSIIDVHSHFIKNVLYPSWDNTTFQVDKSNSNLFPEMHQHMWNDNKTLDFWNGQVTEFAYGIDSKFLVKNSNGRISRLKDCFTKMRYLD